MLQKALPRLLFALLIGGGLLALSSRQRPVADVSPEDALATFQLAEGFQIELVASEPLISDPVAMEIDEQGRLYVVEMHGYPLELSGSGKVVLLTDTDHDGRMDQSQVFAEGLTLPTGIMRWKQGVIVTDAPHVLYLADADGDGRAEIRDTLLTGFARSNPQHNLNSPLLGLDNWIYLGHEGAVSTQAFQKEFGDRGGDVRYPGRKDSPTLPDNAQGQGVRFRPDRTALEMLSGRTQFGHTFDAWGRYFVVNNANHAMHQVVPAAYLHRNPHLLVATTIQTISDHGAAAEVFSITKNPLNQLLTDLGVFTSACGPNQYQGGLFPTPFNRVSFVAEPVSNLVHADVLHDDGATFTASRLYPDKEFLASTDAWFRPVNLYTGPDGALYVTDYYRQIIEHPEWMADEVVQSGALYNGTDKGRLYRITPKGTPPATWQQDLARELTNAELRQKLADPNGWWRRTAQRLLIDRQATDYIPALQRMATEEPNPLGRLHALWTLEGLDALSPQLLEKVLNDPIPGLRENAIKLAEPFLDQAYLNKNPELSQKLLSLQNDTDAKVRFQLLGTLGFLESPEAMKARENVLFRDIQDPWVQITALSARPTPGNHLLNAVLDRYESGNASYSSLIQRLSTLTGTGGTATEIKTILNRSLQTESGKPSGWQGAVLQGLAQGLKNNQSVLSSLRTEQKLLVNSALTHPSEAVREGSVQLLRLLGLPEGDARQAAQAVATKTAANPQESTGNRTSALHFLALSPHNSPIDLLKKLIVPTEPLPVQLAALGTLSAMPGPAVSQFSTMNWASLGPEVRNTAINTFLENDQRVGLLLDALENRTIDPASLGWPRTVRLMNYRDIPLRTRARTLLANPTSGRAEVVAQYVPALKMEGSATKGQMVFSKNCSACHQIGGAMGTPYGPDLATIRNRRPESIMGDILNPALSIADGYDLWHIEMKSGETVQGIIATESPTALTLRSYGGEETVLPRQTIKSLKSLNVSVMPAGLESQISPEDMADLLAFLKKGS
jgi:putative membrane-bound dehydrogenase-like protein